LGGLEKTECGAVLRRGVVEAEKGGKPKVADLRPGGKIPIIILSIKFS